MSGTVTIASSSSSSASTMEGSGIAAASSSHGGGIAATSSSHGGGIAQRMDSMSTFLRARKTKDDDIYAKADLRSKFSPMQMDRRAWTPELPEILRCPVVAVPDDTVKPVVADAERLAELFPATWGKSFLKLENSTAGNKATSWNNHALRVGVVLSGGQAAGGHNVISGIFDYAKQLSAQSQVFGFLGGPYGIFSHEYKEISEEFMDEYRNMGGFDMICSGRHKIETEEQKRSAMEICAKLELHGLVVIGGDDSNTNAAILAEYFKANSSSTCVIGCPKTIDGDLRNEYVETSFGFDTACKTYSELIGNLCVDAATSQDRYHFVRLMGRSASNITLECALQTRCNLTYIGEEVLAKKQSLHDLVDELVTMIIKRNSMKKDFGVVLLPEGLIEFIPEIGALIKEINDMVAAGPFDKSKLTKESLHVFNELPTSVADTLLLDRDPHGNVQVSKIATEQLLIQMAEKEIKARGHSKIGFIFTSHFFGYEGRCAMPSNFDANYCYALGHTAGALVDNNMTGYMAVVRHLNEPAISWLPGGCPITIMMNLERRKGKDVPVIKKYLVELDTPLFKNFCAVREQWKYSDLYKNPGPIQFEGAQSDMTNYSIVPPTMEELRPPTPESKCWFPQNTQVMSNLQKQRLQYRPEVNPILKKAKTRAVASKRIIGVDDQQNERFVHRAFPLQSDKHQFLSYNLSYNERSMPVSCKIGVVLGGQSVPGANNVVHGLFERCQLTGGQLIGFKGLTGLMKNEYVMLEREDIQMYMNQGGFCLLGRTPTTKLLMRTKEGIEGVTKTVQSLKLDGLVIIGGQTSLTDATVITEHFLVNNISCSVIGVPANQENNVRHPMIETALGFDSTSKCYSSLIGNLLTDAASAKKYWYFIRLMGMVPSNIVQEAALSTHPNFVVISEKYAQRNMQLQDIVDEIADLVDMRAKDGKNFGSVLIPEGLVSQIPQLKGLITDVDRLLKKNPVEEHSEIRTAFMDLSPADNKYLTQLAPWSLALLKTLPEFFRWQLVKQTPSGMVELSEIGAEQLLAELVERELKARKEIGAYKGTFSCICHYFGFQGRSTIPSNFDCLLGSSHGYLAGILVESRLTGYVTTVRGLCGNSHDWKLSAVPITALMRVMPAAEQQAYGRQCPMVPCADLDLEGSAFRALCEAWAGWEIDDCYCNPGPIQFEGKTAQIFNRTLYEEQHEYLAMLSELEALTAYVTDVCSFGVSQDILRTSVVSMKGLAAIISDRRKSTQL